MDSVSQFLQSTGKPNTLGTAEDVPRYKEVLHKYYPSTFQNSYISTLILNVERVSCYAHDHYAVFPWPMRI